MSTSKRVVKNTFFLYIRMFLIMGVTLYTSRIVLSQLGVSDYGIYSLVGGIVVMLGFFRGAMATATQRYLSFDIGKNDYKKLQTTFSATLTIHMGIAVLVLFLAETVGLWYVNYKMVFPEGRAYAVNVVYQFSICTFLLNIIQVPYNALILAREKMAVYAYVSILEVVLKLLIVILLSYYGSDKLITYAVLTFLVALVIRLTYQVYCRKKFAESKYHFVYDKLYFKELVVYSGWNLFGNVAAVARTQGSNIILNLFFGTVANAAYGVTTQVQSAVRMFVDNFQLAVNPQIIKSYARGDISQTNKLIFQSSKLSFFLMFCLILPIFYNTEFVLDIWLITVPEHTTIFVRLLLVVLLIDAISGSLMIGVQATGRIKWYQIIVGILVFLNLPLSYLLLKVGYLNPEVVFEVMVILSLITLFFRIYFLKGVLQFPVITYFKQVLCPIIFVFAMSNTILLLILPLMEIGNSWINFVVRVTTITAIGGGGIWLLGLTTAERLFIKNIILAKIFKR